MTYLFDGSVEDLMQAFFDNLDKAAAGGPAREGYFHSALVALVGLYEREARAGATTPERLPAFREASARALTPFADLLTFYAGDARNLAEGANEDEWSELCMRRSAIQVLLDDYADSNIPAFIDRADLAELDAELRRVGEEQGPLPASAIPPGLPAGHGWWHYPPSEAAGAESGTRVLDPALAYATLRKRLETAGWRCVDESPKPIVVDEPEFALFERGAGERLVYSFDPVCRLRLLEGHAPLDPAGRELLPAVNTEQVLDWMRGPEERTLLRGLLAARQMPTPELLARVEILRSHAHATIAKAAAQAAEAMRAPGRK